MKKSELALSVQNYCWHALTGVPLPPLMHQAASNRYAWVHHGWLWIVLILALAACTPKKEAVRADTEWHAPEVQCEQGKTPPIPSVPVLWALEGPAWAVQVLGIAIEERRLRKLEHECMAEHRKKGLIR